MCKTALPLTPSQFWEGGLFEPDVVWDIAPPPNLGEGLGWGLLSAQISITLASEI
ncbi:MAG: hypothetical protein AAF629_07160 [Chloroflexota bacterium]